MGVGEPSASDAELLARTRLDAQAFGDFYRRYERPILGYLMARTRNPDLAADLTSEVFAAALGAADSFDPDRAGSSASGRAGGTPAAGGYRAAHLGRRGHRTNRGALRE